MKKPFSKNKKKRKAFLKAWKIIGIILVLWTIFWLIEVRISGQQGLVLDVILLTIGYTLLIDYFLATAVYFAIKKLKREWEIY